VIITSAQNPRIKAALRLRERRHRDREGLCLVEGFDELSLAVEAGADVECLFMEPRAGAGPAAESLLARLRGAEVLETAEDAFARLSYRENPDGWAAVVKTPSRALEDLEVGASPLLLVVDGVEKPGNLGAMLRTADAAGVSGVILSGAGTDAWNPNVIRASRGAVFSVPLAIAAPDEAIAWLRVHEAAIVAADPGGSPPYFDSDLAGSVAIVVGAEDQGLSGAWRAAASSMVGIPMTGRVNSLNVATAAALLLFEAVRQRGSVSG
jgi:TrmH family RNA methyltransferase